MKPGISKRLVRDAQRRALYTAWTALIASADAFTRRQAHALFDELQQAVGEQIVHDAAASGAGFCDHDERAYDHLARLMDTYRETVALYDSQRGQLHNYNVISIVEGINAVLVSRLKQFEEVAGSDGDNPVTLRKQTVFDKAAGYAAQQITSQARFFNEQKLSGENGVYAAFRTALLSPGRCRICSILAAANFLLDTAKSCCFKGMFAFYRDGLRLCVNELNTRTYLDMLDSENEVLGSIIKVQAYALEFTIKQSQAAAQEQSVIQQILTLLREAYQHFSRAVAEINPHSADTTHIKPGQAYANFEQILDARLTGFVSSVTQQGEEWYNETDTQKTAFHAALEKETKALFDQINTLHYKAAYRFQRIFSEEVIMADEMAAIFEKVMQNWPDITGLPEESSVEIEILHGIAETIQIKIESMKENIAAFNEKGVSMINVFAGNRKEFDHDDLAGAYDSVLEIWKNETPASENEVNEFFNRLLALPVFAPYREFYEKQEAEYTAKIDKALLTFKREILLYEVSTYEEILLYSVSRLRDSEAESVRLAVELLDATLSALDTLLKKNNIQIIRPAPHDMFNGREHEVLVAEQQEGFCKGEIIKPLCSGYRQKDTVILRANVIAAK